MEEVGERAGEGGGWVGEQRRRAGGQTRQKSDLTDKAGVRAEVTCILHVTFCTT